MTHTTKHTPGPIDIPTPCSVCGTRGWILARNDTHGLRIERCDECAIMNDSQAWDTAELFLADLLMRFDEGTNLDKATAAPAMYEALTDAERMWNIARMIDSKHHAGNPISNDLWSDFHRYLMEWHAKRKAALAQAEGKHD